MTIRYVTIALTVGDVAVFYSALAVAAIAVVVVAVVTVAIVLACRWWGQ